MMKKYGYLFFLAVTPAFAEEPSKENTTSSQVIVNGSQTDLEKSRDFVAGKILIGRKRIAESGAQNVAEMLRREPAITIGKNGQLGLLGLSGYTQILVDGLPPQGADPYDLDLTQVENIEIIKSATAATGPFGIAGTINIIRRKAEKKAYNQLRANSISTGGNLGADLAWVSNQSTADASLVYNLTLSAGRRNSPSEVTYSQIEYGALNLEKMELQGHRAGLDRFDTLMLGSDFSWALNPNHKLSFSPDVGRFENTLSSLEKRQSSHAPIQTLQQNNKQPLTSISLPLQWSWKMDAESRMKLRWNINHTSINIENLQIDTPSATNRNVLRKIEQRDLQNHFFDLDYNIEYPGGHEIAAGIKIARNRRGSSYEDLVDGLPSATAGIYNNDNAIMVKRYQVFLQDDWRIDKNVAIGAGLSMERRSYDLNEGPLHNEANFTIWAPTLHIAKRINGDQKRQVRLSLARTFQAPSVDQMLVRPQINPLAQCSGSSLCSANGPDTVDYAGNPNLRPERAIGINLSYTHGIGDSSEAVVELYTRSILDKVGPNLALENVAWANVPRYVTRPSNIGDAKVLGINFEGRLTARDLLKSAPNVELLTGFGFSRSELNTVPGPDNRLPGQSPWRAKIALAYTATGLPLKLNIDANWLPADWTRKSLTERIYQGKKLTLNANAQWTLASGTRLKVNLENIFPMDLNRTDEYLGKEQSMQRYTTTSAFRRIVIGIDMSL